MTNRVKKTKLTIAETNKIADLAKLPLAQKELEIFSNQLTEILDFVEKISEVKTQAVEPLTNVVGAKNVFREDEVKPSLSQKEALSNAPQSHCGYFKVSAVFEND